MISGCIIYLLSIFIAVNLYAQDKLNFSFDRSTYKIEAVLVLAPGMNTDGAFFLKEAPWMEFAKRNNLGVIALNYSSSEEDLYTKTAKDIIGPNKVRGRLCLMK